MRIAREIGDARMLATAAVGFEEACWRPAITDRGAVELLEEASRALADEDSELRVMLLAGLARAQAFLGNFEASGVAEQSAIAMARRLDDRFGLATVLMRSYWSRGERNLEHTLEMLSEARDLAEELGETDMQAEAVEWRIAGLIVLGELTTAERELAEVLELALRLRQPFTVHVAEHDASMLALCFGRLVDAEAAALRSHEWSRLLTGRDASGTYGIQMFGIRREQGRLAELAPAIRSVASGGQSSDVWRPGLAALLAELGMKDEARRELARVRTEGFDALRSKLWMATLTYLTDACAAVGDDALAAMVYPELAPLAGGNVVIGHGVACYGAADRYLGMLAATLGDHDLCRRALRARAGLQPRDGRHHLGGAYPLRVRADAEDPWRSRRCGAGRRAAVGGRGAGSNGSGCRRCWPGPVRSAARSRRPESPPDDLSWREVEILRLVAAGKSNREIGEDLFISGHTVANHVRNILRKTGAANRTEAAGYAYRHALLKRPYGL